MLLREPLAAESHGGSRSTTNTRNVASRRSLAVVVVVVAALLASIAGIGSAAGAPPQAEADFGPNVMIFDDSMSTSDIEDTINDLWEQQRNNEMGTDRYSLLFMPGEYGTNADPLQVAVGYYTEVAGLGASPSDVQINGKIEVFNRCFDANGDPADEGDPGVQCFALNNFWRSISNLTINVNGAGQGGCEASSNFWAVSQAVSMRRVDVNGGNLSLMDYCGPGPQFASGGFIADSRAGLVINGSQQQWITRDSEVGDWSNPVWNQVFTGVVGAPPDTGYPDPPYTTLETTPVSREKPYLFVDAAGDYSVRVPSAQFDSRGITWDGAMTPGRTVPISDFFVADPSDSVQVINNQLARGKHLILTPGVYDVAQSISVKRADAVVLGMGHATLTAVDGAIPLKIADKPGIIVAGVTVDAGTVESPALLQVGKKNGNNGSKKTDPANPTTLSDVYFRVGGPHIGKTDIALEVNSDGVLIDHTWVWRADHGVEGFDETCNEPAAVCPNGFLGDNQRWVTNIGRNGAVINGDDVTATGLFVEHFQEYNTIWNGERGRVYLYQNELPYDPPTQADWTADDGTLGWAAYKVADDVEEHLLWGAGVYIYNRNNPDIVTENGYEVPETPGVQLNHIMTNNLSGPGTINHIVNGCGPTLAGIGDPAYIVTYPPCPPGS